MIKLKVGIVGVRAIGTTHAECHAEDKLSDLVAVCDVVAERADEAATLAEEADDLPLPECARR